MALGVHPQQNGLSSCRASDPRDGAQEDSLLLSRVPGRPALPSLKFRMFAVMTWGDGGLLLEEQLRSWRDLGGALALSSCPLPGLTHLPNPFLPSRATQLWGEALSFPIPVFLSPSGPLQVFSIFPRVFQTSLRISITWGSCNNPQASKTIRLLEVQLDLR